MSTNHKMNLAAMFLVCHLLCYLFSGINKKRKWEMVLRYLLSDYVMGERERESKL